MKVQSLKRMGAGGVAGRVDVATVNTVVRKLGYVLRQAADVMVSNLRDSGEHEDAERLVALLRPLVDRMVAFDMSGDRRRDEDEDTDVSA